MKFLSCIDVHIEDCSNTIVDIQQPCRCCKTIDLHTVDYPCSIDIEDTGTGKCSISNASGIMSVNLQQTSNTVITMDATGITDGHAAPENLTYDTYVGTGTYTGVTVVGNVTVNYTHP